MNFLCLQDVCGPSLACLILKRPKVVPSCGRPSESRDEAGDSTLRIFSASGNWKREYTIETVLDALRREMSLAFAIFRSRKKREVEVPSLGKRKEQDLEIGDTKDTNSKSDRKSRDLNSKGCC